MPPARSGCPLSRDAQFPHMKPLSIQLHKTHGAELSAFIWLWCTAASAGEQGARRQQECQQCLLCASGAPPQVGRHPTRMLQPNQSQQRSHVLWQHMGAPRVSPPMARVPMRFCISPFGTSRLQAHVLLTTCICPMLRCTKAAWLHVSNTSFITRSHCFTLICIPSTIRSFIYTLSRPCLSLFI